MERFDTAAEDRGVADAAGENEGEAVTAMGPEESSQALATSIPQQPGDEQQVRTQVTTLRHLRSDKASLRF